GGPGQPTLPLGEFIARAIAPALAGRDLLLFDQRGTGSSNPLFCRALGAASAEEAVGATLERCAQQIGPARSAFTTQESVADIESLRRAAGYERLVLYGPPTGPTSPSSTRRATPATWKRCCSTRWCPRAGPNRA